MGTVNSFSFPGQGGMFHVEHSGPVGQWKTLAGL